MKDHGYSNIETGNVKVLDDSFLLLQNR